MRSARRLHQRRGREVASEFLVEGTQAVRELLRSAEQIRLLIVDDPDRHRDLLELAGDVRTVTAEPHQVAELAETVTSQGIFAVATDKRLGLADLPAAPKLMVICAQVRDPGNAGTVIRCADAFGADGVVLTHGSVERTNPKTIRASVGSIFHLPVVCGPTIEQAVDWARSEGLQILAADTGGRQLDHIPPDQLGRPTAWVMGNEAWGLPQEVLELVDDVVSIPMWGHAESLNLSTAAAVCIYATGSAHNRGLY